MKYTNNTLRVAIAVALISPSIAFATNGYQLSGVGAYQKSLAGAVTALPGSAMAAVSNPAGAARVGARTDFSMEAFMPDRNIDFKLGAPGATAESGSDMYGVPAIGWVAPTSEGSNMFFGGGMYGTSGLGVDYAPTNMGAGSNMEWDGYSNIAFWQMAPVLAKNVNDKLSVGATLNIDYQAVSFQQRMIRTTDNKVMQNFDLSRAASGFGFGFGVGILYDVSDRLTLGGSYKSKQNFSDLKYQLAAGDITTNGVPHSAGTYKLDLDFPQQAALGLAFKATNKLTLSADVKWIDWSDTLGKLTVRGPTPADNKDMDPGWEDQTIAAIGVSYALNDKVNLRAGYNHSSSPFGANQVSRNLILPAIVETHYAFGGDYRINKSWDLGFHYMRVPKKTLTATSGVGRPMGGTKISLGEDTFGMNIGYRF